jgi:alkyl hydroperoxide reductase subunit F
MFDFNLNKSNSHSKFSSDLLWDTLIVGGGPSGLNAGLYLIRKGKNVGVLTSEIGGQLHNTSDVDNYIGLKKLKGSELSSSFLDHVNDLELPIMQDATVTNIVKQKNIFLITLESGIVLKSKTVLFATGGSPRKLNVPGEKKYQNKGVSYCTTCDAPFFKGKHVVVAGGGNSAAEAVIDLVPYASKISVIHRSQWRADKILLEKLRQIKDLDVHLNSQILEIKGDNNSMRSISFLDKNRNIEKEMNAEGLFIEIGNIPNSKIIRDLVETNSSGEIIVNDLQETSLIGMYASGDVTNQPFKQIIIATGEGAKAALSINKYLNK